MKDYLIEFNKELKAKLAGSLVKVDQIKKPHAKEYLSKLAREGAIDKVTWGWYWIPVKIKDAQDFLRRDRNFKIIADQTAASFWNQDFVHREVHIMKVKDRSLARALEEFGKKKGWRIHAIYTDEQLKYVTINGLRIEDMEQTIIDCLRNYAFEDAFAALYVNRERIKIEEIKRRYYWDRLPRSNIRIRQILEYAWERMNGESGRKIDDDFIKNNIDDALSKVIELG